MEHTMNFRTFLEVGIGQGIGSLIGGIGEAADSLGSVGDVGSHDEVGDGRTLLLEPAVQEQRNIGLIHDE